jgi:hypothetical protein
MNGGSLGAGSEPLIIKIFVLGNKNSTVLHSRHSNDGIRRIWGNGKPLPQDTVTTALQITTDRIRDVIIKEES